MKRSVIRATLLVAICALAPAPSNAQRLEGSGIAVSRHALSLAPVGHQTQHSVSQAPTPALVIGGALGALSAGAILWYGIDNCVDYDCAVPVAIGIAWEGAAIPLGVHLADRGGGHWSGALAGSYGLELLGILVGMAFADQRSTPGVATVAVLTLAAQISYAITRKRRVATGTGPR